MKKIFGLIFAVLFCLSGCFSASVGNNSDIMNSYQKDDAPLQVAKTDDFWAMLFGAYGNHDYSIRIGKTPDSLEEVYTVSDVNIWYFKADGNAVVWCEQTDKDNIFKVYTDDSGKVETFFKTTKEPDYQTMNVGVYNNKAYYCYVDYKNKEVSVLAYDIISKETNTVHKVPFVEESQPYSINIEKEYLSFTCSDKIEVLNLNENVISFEASLSDDIKYVFTASYDKYNDTCAVYYADEDSEDIGVIKSGEKQILSVYTFSENYYAFKEKVECNNGHIYWIRQANVSGMLADNYCFIDYNYIDHKPNEMERTFAFLRDESDIYLLRYNSTKFMYINLCKY